MASRSLFTSESVSMGHPDKLADQVSDAILDAYLSRDPYSRVACETLVKTGFVVIAGEITSRATVKIPDVVRRTVLEVGYDDVAAALPDETVVVDAAAVVVVVAPATVVQGSAMFPRDRVIASLAKYGIAYADDEPAETAEPDEAGNADDAESEPDAPRGTRGVPPGTAASSMVRKK